MISVYFLGLLVTIPYGIFLSNKKLSKSETPRNKFPCIKIFFSYSFKKFLLFSSKPSSSVSISKTSLRSFELPSETFALTILSSIFFDELFMFIFSKDAKKSGKESSKVPSRSNKTASILLIDSMHHVINS